MVLRSLTAEGLICKREAIHVSLLLAIISLVRFITHQQLKLQLVQVSCKSYRDDYDVKHEMERHQVLSPCLKVYSLLPLFSACKLP